MLQNIETNEEGPFGAVQSFSKKSQSVGKKLSEKHQDGQTGFLGMFSRFWTTVLCFGRGSEVSSVLDFRSSRC